jgi:2-polyprenyl-6-methoxyphenol hydroxylase-like FAD-dependent oxidoreductase
MVILAGFLGDHPPEDPEGYLAFAGSLPVPDMARALGALEPISDIMTYKFPANLRRHYDRLARFPDGLVVVGDALASFNPIYGQGMTTAGLGALLLGDCLADQRRAAGAGNLAGLSRRYHTAAAKLVDVPWMMTTGEDFRYPEVTGQRPPLYGAMKWYLGQVHRAAMVDPEVYGTFLRAMHMLDGPEKLMTPASVVRVLRAARRSPAGST